MKPKGDLTNKEVEVLTCLAEGFSNKVIAEKLGMAEATVKTHLYHIFSKLGVRSRLEAARIYWQEHPNTF